MAKVLVDTKNDYEPADGDTLAKIATDKCPGLTWQELAMFNWGTSVPAEVNRALAYYIGCREAKDDCSLSVLDKSLGKTKKIRIPKLWSDKATGMQSTHTIAVKKLTPPNAISITKLDKWFIPGLEECEIKYRLEGLQDRADKVVLEVYGSNYCECTAYNKGLGTYSKTDELVKMPLIAEEQISGNEQRKEHATKVTDPGDEEGTTLAPWKGHVTVKKGLLSTKIKKDGTDLPRYINVAFSPYTVHLRYYKDDADKNARIDLDPFWVEWEEEKTNPAVDKNESDTSAIVVKWTNPDDIDRAVLEVKDKNGQSVCLEEVKTDKGEQTFTWNGNYRYEARNSKFTVKFVADDGPYVYTVTTIRYKPKAESLKVKWKLDGCDRLEFGLIQIFDGKDRIVNQAGLDKAALASKTFEWKDSGKYAPGMKNSKDKDTATRADMPYRIQLQAYAKPGEEKGLAIAAMHTEVRLLVKGENRIPKDIAYDPRNSKPSIILKLAEYVPGDPPDESKVTTDAKIKTRWIRHKLAQAGFHPGPIIDTNANDAEYKVALKEFKRAVPAKGDATGDNFTRLTANDVENAALIDAIKTLRDTDKRAIFGDIAQVNNNADNPDIALDTVKTIIAKPDKDIIVWVDDRQYYTDKMWNSAKDENNADLFQSPFNLENHRGGMSIGDDRTVKDAQSIPRPWIPLQADLVLLSKLENYFGKVESSKADIDIVNLPDDRKNASRLAIGPIRVDWSFDELPLDIPAFDFDKTYDQISQTTATTQITATTTKPPAVVATNTVNGPTTSQTTMMFGDALPPAPAGYATTANTANSVTYTNTSAPNITSDTPVQTVSVATKTEITYTKLTPKYYDKNRVRSRTTLVSLIKDKQSPYTRKDTGKDTIYTNCPGGADPSNATDANNLGGIRTSTLSEYFKQPFGHGDLALQPWQATPDTNTETIATIIHDHLHNSQKEKETLFQPILGAVGAFFHPSRIAGDGYRIRAQVQFEKFTNYEFPNLAALKQRYPVQPQAHSAGMRNWRKSSWRGYACWGAATNHYANDFLNVFRENYRHGHVYFVHEQNSSNTFNLADLIDQATYRKVLVKNLTDPALQVEGNITLNLNDVWPWTGRADLGWAPDLPLPASGQFSDFLGPIVDNTWTQLQCALLLRLLKSVEKKGFMRGHFLVEFDNNIPCRIQSYDCANGHRKWYLETQAGHRMNNQPCPQPGCATNLTVVPANPGTFCDLTGLNIYACGNPLGATWLFWRGENLNRLKAVWPHEIGHHRHLQHAANAPGFAEDLHDSQANSHANWAGVQPPPGENGNPSNNVGEAQGRTKRWDRDCIMSYADCWYSELGCFCGKCLLRNRGWKVSAAALPAAGDHDP